MTTHRGVFVEKRTRQKDGSITPASGIGALYLPHGRYDMTIEGPDGFTGSVEWDGGVPVIVSDEANIVVTLADVQRGDETILTGTVADVNDGLRQIDFSAGLTVLSMDIARGNTVANNAAIAKREAEAVMGVCNEVASMLARIKQLLAHNSDLSIDWATPAAYISVDGDGNITDLLFSPADVSNAVGSLEQVRKCLENEAVSQGDHLGNINKLSRPLG